MVTHTAVLMVIVLAVVLLSLVCIYRHMTRPKAIECPFCVDRVVLTESHDHALVCQHCQVHFVVDAQGDLSPCIEAQAQERDPPLRCAPRLSHGPTVSKSTNGLCRSCNHHQRIIVSLLSQMDPIDQDDEQLADWKSYLERKYPLCSPCQLVVQKKLAGLGQTLKLNYLDLLLAKEKKQRTTAQASLVTKNVIQEPTTLPLCVSRHTNRIGACHIE